VQLGSVLPLQLSCSATLLSQLNTRVKVLLQQCTVLGVCYQRLPKNHATAAQRLVSVQMMKFGRDESVVVAQSCRAGGAVCGINFNDDRLMYNSVRSHKLILLAGQQSKQDATVEAIMIQYFVHGESPS
jgi:predicted DsbA family dithiol-disulfide isomerase